MLKLVKTGHHTPPTDITDQVPVEVFAEHWDGPVPEKDAIIEAVMMALDTHIKGALIRIAVPTSEGHHRCLDVMAVALSGDNEEIGGSLVVELQTESWDNSPALVIRLDDPASAPNPEPYLADPNWKAE